MVKGLSSRIAKIREERGMSASDLARLLGVSATAVWNWEKNGVTPRSDMLSHIAQVLGVTESYLLAGDSRKSSSAKNKSVPDVIEAAQNEIAAITGMPAKRIRVRVEFE